MQDVSFLKLLRILPIRPWSDQELLLGIVEPVLRHLDMPVDQLRYEHVLLASCARKLGTNYLR